MGLTNSSIGLKAVDSGLTVKKTSESDRVIALAGNPNVGKSTVFNALTGLNQHTGNWPGKTVACATGVCRTESHSYILVDIPGTYSLMAHSAEEEVARDFICFGKPDGVVVVCDATCLERNLNLVLQTMEITENVIVCVNLLDEAKKKNIRLDLEKISERLGVPVIGIVARKKKSLEALTKALDDMTDNVSKKVPLQVKYPDEIESAVSVTEQAVRPYADGLISPRWLSLVLPDADKALLSGIEGHLGFQLCEKEAVSSALTLSRKGLREVGIDSDVFKDKIVSALVETSEKVCKDCVTYDRNTYGRTDRKIDRLVTSRLTGYPLMLILLAVIFWITISGANYPSQLLSGLLFGIQDFLSDALLSFGVPDFIRSALVEGMYRVLAWVVSVMLPPMAIFFPLFTLLEDAGYLPRIAYNLDKPFKRCRACGKQALTMCMGFGCNAAGIVGCRIIDSPRERLLAILTNNFVPCNGRFPTLIAILGMFFITSDGSFTSSVKSALLLTAVIVFGIVTTFAVTRLLSGTVLRGVPSSFTLEMPPYRRPQIGKVIVRSIFDRTLFVLGRAVAVAAPAGLIIWLMANLKFGSASLLNHTADFLDPFARLLGLDGVILLAFILGFPANEIVLPIIIMTYMAQGSLTELSGISQMRQLFISHGWTQTTAICVMLFSLMHWPCSTTLITIKKETGSAKWTLIAAVLPTLLGILCCMTVNAISALLS